MVFTLIIPLPWEIQNLIMFLYLQRYYSHYEKTLEILHKECHYVVVVIPALECVSSLDFNEALNFRYSVKTKVQLWHFCQLPQKRYGKKLRSIHLWSVVRLVLAQFETQILMVSFSYTLKNKYIYVTK